MRTRPDSIEANLVDLCLDSTELLAVIARVTAGSGVTRGELEREVGDAGRLLRTGGWESFERHLEEAGAEYARAGVGLGVWLAVGFAVLDTVQARAFAVHGGDAARLQTVLGSAAACVQRSLSAITAGYYRAREVRERQVTRRHDGLIDAALDAVIEIDERGVITEFSSPAERMFGHRKVDAIGQQVEELIIPHRMRERHRAGLARQVAGGPPRAPGSRLELAALHADGSEFPVELSLVAAERLDGRRCFIAWLRDLRDRRYVEESLAVRAHALEQAQFGVVVVDPETQRITSVNPAYARLIGYSVAELIGAGGDQLMVPGTQHEVAAIIRVLRERGHLTYRVSLRAKDGATVPVMVSSSTVTTGSGGTVRISTVLDISEQVALEQQRVAAQRELERVAARLQILSQASHEFSSASGDVDALLSIVVRRLGEVIGDGSAVRLLSGDGAWLEPSTHVHYADPELDEFARRLIARERQRVGDGVVGRVAETGEAILIPAIDVDGLASQIPPVLRALIVRAGVSSAMALPLRARGRMLGVVSLLRGRGAAPYTIDDQRFAQDLADRAGLALDNALLVTTLEQRVAERTAALEAANRDLEAFNYSVSHDLRTPLRALDGFSLALLEDYEGQLDAQGQRYLRQIRSAAGRMGQLIDDLLALARVSLAEPAFRTVDLSALATDVAAQIRNRQLDRSTPIHIAPGLSGRGDPRLLRIVLENLVGNAWKYTARHTAAEIWVGAEDDTFHVRDTGAGFDMRYADKLFRPFQRLHGGPDYEGTGIGLAIVARILGLHGGRIWATGAVGRGATFFFTLGDARA